MRLLPAGLAVSVLAATLTACGASNPRSTGASGYVTGTAATAPNFSVHHNDRDNDGDHNNDDEKVLYYGQTADAADRRASIALVKRYFALAAAGNGAAACGLLAPLLAETLAETDGHSPQLRGSTCAQVLAKLFEVHHRELTTKRSTLRVLEVRQEGAKELVVLDFATIPEVRQMTLKRFVSGWRLMVLLDGILE